MNVVAIMRTGESAALLRETLKDVHASHVEIFVDRISDIARNEHAMNGHDVLLVDIDASDENETSMLSEFIQKHHRSRPVIVTTANAGENEIRRVMEIGAVHLLPQPIREMDFIIAMDHASRHRSAEKNSEARKGKIISFLKAGGGVGATTIAVQGGVLLARARKKEPVPKVCILDLDIQFGSVGFYLDKKTPVGLADLLESADRIDHSLLSSVVFHHESGVDVISAPTEIFPLESVTEAVVKTLLDITAESYDYVLVDLPQAWTSWSHATLSGSDEIILVAQPSVPALQHISDQLKTMASNQIESPVRLVLNRHKGGWATSGAAFVKEAQKSIGRKFDHFIANDYEIVRDAIDRGVTLSKIRRRSKVEKDIRKLFAEIKQSLTANEVKAVADGPD